MKTIVQKESLILRGKANNIDINEISSPRIQKIILEMKEALASQDDGVAIAAPQIGYPFRIFVVSGKVTRIMKGLDGDESTVKYDEPDTVYINPILKKISKEKKYTEEGCLSVRYLYGKVRRSIKATVAAYDENGNKFTKGGSGLLAQIFQHETDHLDGILFTDKAKDIEEILPKKIRKNKNE